MSASAEAGDADAQHWLAEAYRVGKVVPQDLARALCWYRTAAEQGHARAQNDLGSMYLNGVGIAADAREAVRWHRSAAEQGEPHAQFNVGLRYLHGVGVAQDDREAAEWIRSAAVQGHVEAIGELGTLYRFGRGVEQELVTAADLHVAAALDGDVVSAGNLADYRAEIEKAAVNGSLVAALCLAKMFDRGLGIETSKARMFAWLLWGERRGALDGEPDYADELADMKTFYATTLSEADRMEAETLFGQMLAAAHRTGG
jgi:TPR repeat protein